MPASSAEKVLSLPIQVYGQDDIQTIRDYLRVLLIELWLRGEQFCGKRPLGQDGWDWELMIPLVSNGFIDGEIDDNGFLVFCDENTGKQLIEGAIIAMCERPPSQAPDNHKHEVIVNGGQT